MTNTGSIDIQRLVHERQIDHEQAQIAATEREIARLRGVVDAHEAEIVRQRGLIAALDDEHREAVVTEIQEAFDE